MRRFSVYRRTGQRVYYAQIKNPRTGRCLPARSTGQVEESEALLIVADWIQNGLPESSPGGRRETREALTVDTAIRCIREVEELTKADTERIVKALVDRGAIEAATLPSSGPEAAPLLRFLTDFWNFDTSPYVKEKLAFGHSIGRRHCYEQTGRLHHWRTFFGEEIRLCDVTRDQLKEFQQSLRAKLAAKTCNTVFSAGSVAFGWAAAEKIITADPAKKLKKFSGRAKKRGILTTDQAAAIFSVPWKDERTRVGNLVAMTTGLRAGEVLALRREDIGTDRLYVRHSWSFADGLKAPKNGDEGEVPLLPFVRDELPRLADTTPWRPNGFIFYGTTPGKPMNLDALSRDLQEAFLDTTVKRKKGQSHEQYQEAREKARRTMIEAGICFHSWRHFYAAHLRDRVELRGVQLVTRHKSGPMAEAYADHVSEQHFEGVSRAVADIFGKVVPFQKAAGNE